MRTAIRRCRCRQPPPRPRRLRRTRAPPLLPTARKLLRPATRPRRPRPQPNNPDDCSKEKGGLEVALFDSANFVMLANRVPSLFGRLDPGDEVEIVRRN